MCFACLLDSQSWIDIYEESAKRKHKNRLDQAKHVAENIKRWFEIVDEENAKDDIPTCPSGEKNLDVYRQKMYEIAREI
jgi:hypothetical protein